MDKYYDLRGMERQPVEATGPAEPVRSNRLRRRLELWHFFVALACCCGALALGTQGGDEAAVLAVSLGGLGISWVLYWYFRSAILMALVLLLYAALCIVLAGNHRHPPNRLGCRANLGQLAMAFHHDHLARSGMTQ